MALVHYDLFWENYLDHCELERLRGIFTPLDFSEIVCQIRIHRNRKGRQDWPIEAMLQALFEMIVLQHRSVASLRRELKRNPTLMIALGFELKPVAFELKPVADCDRGPFVHYKVPSDGAFSRFRQTLIEVDEKSGCVSELLPDLGARVGYDGLCHMLHRMARRLNRIQAATRSRTKPIRSQASNKPQTRTLPGAATNSLRPVPMARRSKSKRNGLATASTS